MTIPQQTTFLPTVKSKHIIKTTAGVMKEPSCTPKEVLTSSGQSSTAPPPKKLAQCKITDILLTPSAKSNESDEVDEESINQDLKTFYAYCLVDITPTKRKHHHGPSQPRKTILDTYLQKCYQPSMPGKHLYHCIGKDCNITFSNWNLQ